jgi:hypothetical protein
MRQRHKEMMMMPFICKSMYLPVFCLLSGQGPSVDLENDTSVGDHTASCTTDAKESRNRAGLPRSQMKQAHTIGPSGTSMPEGTL